MKQFCILSLQVFILVMSILSNCQLPDNFTMEPCFDPFVRFDVENGQCKCPDDYPVKERANDVLKCCTDTSNSKAPMKICKCELNYAYHSPTNDCYKINMDDYTIRVNRRKICYDENLKLKKGKGCCTLNMLKQKVCHCTNKNTIYNSFLDICEPGELSEVKNTSIKFHNQNVCIGNCTYKIEPSVGNDVSLIESKFKDLNQRNSRKSIIVFAGPSVNDCPIPFLKKKDKDTGLCVCPEKHYPNKNGMKMCCTTEKPLQCLCEYNHVYRSDKDECYKINMTDYTIEVDGKPQCQNENLKVLKGKGCCMLNEQGHKSCQCTNKNESYQFFTDKCKTSF